MDFNDYGFIQSLSLIVAVVFFILLLVLIFKRPKDYYKETSELPLDDDND